MVSPYIVLGKDHVFKAIHSREEGYCPASQEYTLDDLDAKPTIDASEVSGFATMLSDPVDAALRTLASTFIDNMDRMILNNTPYSLPDDGT